MAKPISNSGFSNWTPDRLPDLSGRRYLVTGGNAGLGYEAALLLAAKNADVVIASRNIAKAKKAVGEIDRLGSGKVESVTLDLSSLDSVRAAAEDIGERYDRLDAVVNNAGVMQTPETRTADGFELQLATNQLGHFLLNGLIFALVEKAGGRIVAVSSIVHRRGQIHLDDLMLTKNYSPTRAYSQSKLANLIYALELDRRLTAAGSTVTAIACHPGYAATDLQSTGPRGFFNVLYRITNPLFAQSAAAGAVPLVLAAAGKEAKAGAYYGPTSRGDSGGPVGDSSVAEAALDRDVAAKLWQESEKLVGFEWSSVLGKSRAGA